MPFIEAPTNFYLGRRYDAESGKLADEVIYYDSRDLTTHAVVVGMTGSGKTGMCLTMLEEAVMDNIPAICIDPKGDITNLLLTFPQLRAEDFGPWVNPDDARRAGMEPTEFAADVAQQWKDGLQSWSIVPGRIQAMRNAAQFSIYTPGSPAGLPISILNSLQAPREGWAGREELHRERIAGIVTALMALIGRQVEPVKDREHVLISNIFEEAWKQGNDLTLEDIILQVQKPPFGKLGVFDVNTFFPEKDRFKLAKELNNIIAAPSFQSWIAGEALDIGRMLYTSEGRPRVSILYLAHLSDSERMFIITLLLENLNAWMRTLSGTTSLRAILYFDEVFGFFPPAPYNPPSKEPLLRLLKQGRGFGVGCILATQNPGDLDYKGLSNAGTWIIGKLQTENDLQRVLTGLQTAATADTQLQDDDIRQMLASLRSRVFMLHNVHDPGGPILMHTRYTMSYLRGPLTRDQINILMRPQLQAYSQNYNQNGQSGYAAPVQQTPAAPTSAPVDTSAYTGYMGTPPPRPVSTPVGTPPAANPPVPDVPAEPPMPTPADSGTGGFKFFSSQRIEPVVPASMNYPAPQPSSPVTSASQPVNTGSMTARRPDAPNGYSERPPVITAGKAQYFLPTTVTPEQAVRNWERQFGFKATWNGGSQLVYDPVLLAQLAVRYIDIKKNIEEDQRWAFHVTNLTPAGFVKWMDHQASPIDPGQAAQEPYGVAMYGDLASGLTDSKRLTALRTEVTDYVYRTAALTIYTNPTLKIFSMPRELRRDFLVKAGQVAREMRDAEIDKVTRDYDDAIRKLDDRRQAKLRSMGIRQEALDELKREDLYTTGEAIFSLMQGRTAYTLSRMSRARRYKKEAQEQVIAGQSEIDQMENDIENKQQELQVALKAVDDKWTQIAGQVQETKLTPLKKDIALEMYGIGWRPSWYVNINGQATMLPAYPQYQPVQQVAAAPQQV